MTIKKIMLTEHSSCHEEEELLSDCSSVLNTVEVECCVRLGTLTLTIGQLRDLKHGQILSLNEKTNELVDILIQNQVIARGELLCMGEYFAIQITELAS